MVVELKHDMKTARNKQSTAVVELVTKTSLEGKAWALPTLTIPIVDRTMRTGKTDDGGRRMRMRKSTIREAKAAIGNTFGDFDFCFTDIRVKYTDRITQEITMKNFRKSSSCS